MWCQSVRISRLLVTAQTGLTVSLQLEEAGRVSIMRKAGDILFAFLFQIFIFQVRHCATAPPLHVVSGCVVCQEVPGLWSVVGASLVAGAVLVSSARKLLPKSRRLACCRHQPGEAEHQQRLRS